MRWSRNQSEHGVIAVIVAISAVLLLSIAALAVDLGNAYSRKRDVQSQADFAALAGGAKLPAAAATNCAVGTAPSAGDLVVKQVVAYLNANETQNDAGVTTVTATALVDCVLFNGEVTYPTKNSVKVWAPVARVDYGLAKVMGKDNVNVQADATVNIESPGTAVMPVFGVDGCDFGPQTITDPAAGHAVPVPVPWLAYLDGESNNVSLDLITTSITPVPVNASGYTVTVGDDSDITLANVGSTVGRVGFFRALGSSGTTFVAADSPHTFGGAGANKTVTVTIPAAVTAVEDVWYIRVQTAAGGRWSARSEAQPLRIGNATLECSGTSNDGNFGTLTIPRTDTSNSTGDGWLPVNMAVGLQAPLTLAVYPAPAPDTCGAAPAIVSGVPTPGLIPGTNCVDTDTGLPANSATNGLIAGAGGHLGRLDKNTTPGCGADSADRNARWVTGIGPGSTSDYSINDDLLTCFLTDDTTTLNTIVQRNYNGGAVLTEDIFRSPRFMWIPILKVEPFSGGSNKYSIVDFRPAFLTDQPLTANRVNNLLGTVTDHNGLTITNDDILTAKVIFFNAKALPATADPSLPSTPYLGFGTKILRLTD